VEQRVAESADHDHQGPCKPAVDAGRHAALELHCTVNYADHNWRLHEHQQYV